MQAATYAIAVFGLSIVLGLCGQINLAQAAFFALGAYSVALGTADYHLSFWLCLAIGIGTAFASGALLGVSTLRLGGQSERRLSAQACRRPRLVKPCGAREFNVLRPGW